MKKLLVISTKRTANVEKMLAHLRQQLPTIRVDYVTYDDLIFSFIDGTPRVHVEGFDADLADYDMAYFKSSVMYDVTAAYVQYALRHGLKVTDESKADYPGVSKLYAYSIIAAEGIAVPNTLFMTPHRATLAYDTYVETLGVPFVLQGIHASRGDINEVVRSREDFDRITSAAVLHVPRQYLVGQSFIPNDGDLRILVFGDTVRLVIHRMRVDDSTHLNNTSQGGAATIVPLDDLPGQVIADSNKAAQLMQLGIAGVDMVQHKETGKWYCFEVNEGPQMATGSHREQKWNQLARYFMTELEK